jgi:excisionase family DNA binding protein
MTEYLSVIEAAELRGVSEKTIRNYIHQGRIAAERFGPKLLYIHVEELDRAFTPVFATRNYGTVKQPK